MATFPLFFISHSSPKNLQLPNGGLLLLLDGRVLTGSSKNKYKRVILISESFIKISAKQPKIQPISRQFAPRKPCHNSEFILTQSKWHTVILMKGYPIALYFNVNMKCKQMFSDQCFINSLSQYHCHSISLVIINSNPNPNPSITVLESHRQRN